MITTIMLMTSCMLFSSHFHSTQYYYLFPCSTYIINHTIPLPFSFLFLFAHPSFFHSFDLYHFNILFHSLLLLCNLSIIWWYGRLQQFSLQVLSLWYVLTKQQNRKESREMRRMREEVEEGSRGMRERERGDNKDEPAISLSFMLFIQTAGTTFTFPSHASLSTHLLQWLHSSFRRRITIPHLFQQTLGAMIS